MKVADHAREKEKSVNEALGAVQVFVGILKIQ